MRPHGRGSALRKGNTERLGDSGLSLVELVVYVLLSMLVLSGVTMVFVNSWQAQENVTSETEATNRGQLTGSTIERAMRNGLDFSVSDDGAQLRVRTSLGGSLACQGFLLTAGQARMSFSGDPTPLPPVAATWAPWQAGIAQRGSTPFFAVSGQTVTYTFNIDTEGAPVSFTGEASTRSAPTGDSGSCW